MATDQPGIFEIIDTTRAMKRLKPDPVPLELLRKVLDAGTKAPSGVNTQPWEFLVVRDPETKKWVQERYLHFAKERFGALVDSLEGVDTPNLEDLDRLFAQLREQFGRADVLFANAGIAPFLPSEAVTEEHFDNLFNVNVRGGMIQI